MALPYSYPYNVTSFLSLMHYANNAVDGMLGLGILIAMGIIIFLATKLYSYERALGLSAFITFIIALFFKFINLISDGILFGCIVYLIAGIIALWSEREKESG